MLSTATDPNSANNSASASTTVKPVADLGLTKSDSPDPVLAGQLLTYTLGVSNAGPHGATGVTVTDTLPAGVDLRLGHAPRRARCSESAGTVTCALGTVANGGDARASRSRSGRTTQGTVTNQASVTSDAGDLNRSNNSASAADDRRPRRRPRADEDRLARPGAVRPAADLHPDGRTTPARRATSGVALSDTLPGGRDVRLRHHHPGQLLQVGRHRRSARSGTLADEADATVEIKVTAQTPGTITNKANVLGIDRRPGHRRTTRRAPTPRSNPAADLSLTKSDSPDPVLAGELLTYTLGVAQRRAAERDRGDAHRHAARRA